MASEKYTLTKKQHSQFKKLRQIVATVDIPGVCSKGEFGGYIETERNLSQTGNCWVSEGCFVFGNAMVLDDAILMGDVTLSDAAVVKDRSIVEGKCKIMGHAVIAGTSNIGGKLEIGNSTKLTNVNLNGKGRIEGNAEANGG